MQITKAVTVGLLMAFLAAPALMAQGIGEYGRTLGGVGQRQGSVSPQVWRGPSQNAKGKAVIEGIGDLGRPLPSGLVVVSKQAVLYPRQDDEGEKVAELSKGDTLIPMGQSNGGNDWYMVKTQNGLIGWIKAADVREEAAKKQ
jgi:hypothetical protein